MDFSYLDDWLEEEEKEQPAVPEVGEGYRNIWVFAESRAGALVPATLETAGQARGLADRIGVYVYGVLVGRDDEALAQELISHGADRILVAEGPGLDEYQPDIWAHVLADLVSRYRPEILLLAATPLGNDLAPRLAEKLNTGLMSHCVKLDIDMAERLLIGTSPVMGGEVYHAFACPQARPQMATLEAGFYPTPYPEDGRYGTVERVPIEPDETLGKLQWIRSDATVDQPAVLLSRAKVVVAAGRGMGNEQGFALAKELAAALGGVVAGTRGAFDEGWIGEEAIVGVGGSSIAPDLYIACGVSGDVFHSFGVQDAKFVVAINPDEQAPIIKRANIAIVGDAQPVIQAMLEAMA
jgi:electron transfer flavoprotein alpha subunit